MTQVLDVVHPRRRRATLAALVLVAVAVLAPAADARTAAQPRIVAGTPVDPALFPYVATLKLGGELHCGGSLIAPDRVLTAAHCLPDLKIGDQVQVGPVEMRTIIHLAQDPRLTALVDGGRSSDDVLPFDDAIVTLNAPVLTVAPLRLAQPPEAAFYAQGALLTAVGMGSENTQREGAGVLRAAQVVARADVECKTLLGPLGVANDFVPEAMLCTTDPDGAAPFRSGCYGDSGSPLVAVPDGITPVQVGIDDWGVACGFKDGDPENYVEVAAIVGFALSPAPVFRPEPQGRPRITGTAKVGRKVRCQDPLYADPQPDKISHGIFEVRGQSVQILARSRSYRIPRRLRGHRLTCAVLAHSAGGELATGATNTKRVR